MKKQILSAVFLATTAAVAVTPSHAADNFAGWYAGGSIGTSKMDKPVDDAGQGPSKMDSSKTGYKFFGGYQFNQNLAVEGAYTDFGRRSIQANAAPDKLSSNTWSVAAVGFLPISNEFSLIGKAGLARNHLKTESGDGMVYTNNKNSILLGIGGQYEINKQTFIRVEYENYGKVGNGDTNGCTGKTKFDFLSVGLSYKF